MVRGEAGINFFGRCLDAAMTGILIRMTENAPMSAPLDKSSEYYGEMFGCHLEPNGQIWAATDVTVFFVFAKSRRGF